MNQRRSDWANWDRRELGETAVQSVWRNEHLSRWAFRWGFNRMREWWSKGRTRWPLCIKWARWVWTEMFASDGTGSWPHAKIPSHPTQPKRLKLETWIGFLQLMSTNFAASTCVQQTVSFETSTSRMFRSWNRLVVLAGYKGKKAVFLDEVDCRLSPPELPEYLPQTLSNYSLFKTIKDDCRQYFRSYSAPWHKLWWFCSCSEKIREKVAF